MLIKAFIDMAVEFYSDFMPALFEGDKEPDNHFAYQHFRVRNFRGLDDVSLDISKGELLLLLGLNESGKTSILKSIEAFDFSNDPRDETIKSFFTSFRNKQDIDSSIPCIMTATIKFTQDLKFSSFKKFLQIAGFGPQYKDEIENFFGTINGNKQIEISRIIPFLNGTPGKSYYKIEGQASLSSPKLERVIAQAIVSKCPFIIYFEDFQDSIPERIYTSRRSAGFNQSWFEIIDGLFYNTDASYNISKFETYFKKSNPRTDDASSVLRRVNKTLQKTFTEKWENLSGVQDIDEAELKYDAAGKFFEFKISENDGTTYSVHERSKGAIWYLAFLMKTEFRRKKLREGSGKPVYLIDEPASNLHSTAQQKMVEDFFRLVEDTSLIYTTHSRYLISPGNVKNTYVVRRENGTVQCTRWSDYIKGKDAKISYYQPLYDCLNIVPNNFEIPWEFAIITEGPSDALALEIMFCVLGLVRKHAIYPGSTASDLGTLISLNLGWGATFKVLLDSDDEGNRQRGRYEKAFGLSSDTFVQLPGKGSEIEDMFSKEEKSKLAKLVYGNEFGDISKGEFLALFREIHQKVETFRISLVDVISAQTKATFGELIEQLTG